MRRLVYLVLLMTGLAPTQGVLGRTCEQWRDFLYYRDTGEFIEWVGEPYEICDSPSPRPGPPGGRRNDLPENNRDQYEGGWGESVAERCEKCSKAADEAFELADKHRGDCESDTLWRSKELCEQGLRRGRPPGPPIPEYTTSRQRVCEDDDRGHRICRFVTVREPNPEAGDCYAEWQFGFTDEEIATGRNRDGQRIDTLPIFVDIKYDGHFEHVLFGADQDYQALCDAPYNRELDDAENALDVCEAEINVLVESAGHAPVECR